MSCRRPGPDASSRPTVEARVTKNSRDQQIAPVDQIMYQLIAGRAIRHQVDGYILTNERKSTADLMICRDR